MVNEQVPAYRLFHKIRAVADIDGGISVELSAFAMRAVGPTNGSMGCMRRFRWLRFLLAYNSSRRRLVRTVDALSILTQCAFSLAVASFSVYPLKKCLGLFLRKRRDSGKLDPAQKLEGRAAAG